jgi:NAD(P)H-dependent FMN reductase
MSDLKIAVVLGSTRPGRRGKVVADWVVHQASTRLAAEYELVDLADYPLPHLDEPMPPSRGSYAGGVNPARRLIGWTRLDCPARPGVHTH